MGKERGNIKDNAYICRKLNDESINFVAYEKVSDDVRSRPLLRNEFDDVHRLW